ncbi:hypothetical protein PR048_010392 [Dryococelus australis]|uniref:Uncharacterized protein n=1 Tax=Dryococelus australis TaxID=614101 RepID=A0ABQ9I2L5_9NEOP|nr:hypothetical protein PR048_010392 [Dryococelus australis]
MRVIEIPEKTHKPTASSGTIPTCENPVTRPGIEPDSHWWEPRVLIAQTPCPPPPPEYQEERLRRAQVVCPNGSKGNAVTGLSLDLVFEPQADISHHDADTCRQRCGGRVGGGGILLRRMAAVSKVEPPLPSCPLLPTNPSSRPLGRNLSPCNIYNATPTPILRSPLLLKEINMLQSAPFLTSVYMRLANIVETAFHNGTLVRANCKPPLPPPPPTNQALPPPPPFTLTSTSCRHSHSTTLSHVLPRFPLSARERHLTLAARELQKIWSNAGVQGRGKWEIPEKKSTRRPEASSRTIPTCENTEATPPGIEPGSPL